MRDQLIVFLRVFSLSVVVFFGTTCSGAGTKTNETVVLTPVEQAQSNAVEKAVVKIFCTTRYPDYYRPWTKQSPSEATGTGVVLEGKRILTCAHVVLYASQVQVQANQSADKIFATVEAIAPGVDLAVLKLDDESFFDSHPPLPRSAMLPEIKDAVLAYGYPKGGTSLSITKGIVSRIEFDAYNNLPVRGLRLQIDAALNPGNSGGAVVVGDKMIGLAFSYLEESQNIGYIIPTEEIDLFLRDIADGHYDGKPAMYDDLQTLENPALRAFLKLDKSAHGMIVHKPDSDSPGYPLKQWDLITRIGDTPIDDQGMIQINNNLRVQFPYLIQKLAKDGVVPLTVLRAGKEISVNLPVPTRRSQVIPYLEGTYPSYFICGPMVFSRATADLSGSIMRNSNRWLTWMGTQGSPLLTRWYDKPAFEDESIVVVTSAFFPNRLVTGYSEPYLQTVKTINNIPIKNLNHLVAVLRDCKDDFITIEFSSRYGETLVFPRAEFLAATDEVLTDNGIRSQGTPDTMAVWNAKPK